MACRYDLFTRPTDGILSVRRRGLENFLDRRCDAHGKEEPFLNSA